MSAKRRGAAAASPDLRMRSQKRRKVSEEEEDVAEQEESPPTNADEEDGNSEAGEEDEEGEEEVEEDESEANFEGDSIQAAQDKIIAELTRLKDSDGEDVAYPFVGKPDRNLYRDYYEVIKHPVSLRSIQQKVRGTEKRKNPSRITAFPTWQSFEEEVSYLWGNAREYNEDDSDIVVLAGILEEYFKRRVVEAKKLVPDSVQTETPAKDGVAVDNDALKRQQDLVRTGSASQSQDVDATRTRSLRRQIASPRSSVATTPSASEKPHPVPTNGRDSHVKDETPQNERSNAVPESTGPPHEVPAPAPPPESVSPLDSIYRRPGQDANSALIQHVQIQTHPSLSLPQDLCLEIPPSPTLRQQAITITLPPSHRILTVRPTLVASSAEKQTKIVATMGTHRIHPSGDSPLAYDIQLHPGTTKVDLEAIAGPPRGAPKSGPPGSEVDYERVTIFFNLLR